MANEADPIAAGYRYTAIHFGYGSNLSPKTMKQRCPDCLYAGMARLDDYKWIINETGYANVIPSPGDVVYGGLYFLSNRDEAALDHSEGVSFGLYEKHYLEVTRIGQATEQKVEAMAYVDVQRTTEGKIEEDYIIWINRAIKLAMEDGVPASYVEKYLRPFTPAGVGDDTEINMVRTHMKIGQGSLLDQELGSERPRVSSGWMLGGGGRGSTAPDSSTA